MYGFSSSEFQFVVSRYVRYQMDARCILFLLLVCFITYSTQNSGTPKFGQRMSNLTVASGRDAIFLCVVEDLATYKVAWLRVDTQTILTIHSHVITKNHRISVTHTDEINWYLKIRDVRETDQGFYMCQINTDPMKSQVGFLNVVVPPDILDQPTSADQVIREGSNLTLRCAASGSPTPNITWRREASELIAINNEQGVHIVDGPLLNIPRVNRSHMGAYLCIASNGIPPSVSKRIMLDVHFPPMIWIENQSVGARTEQQVTLECYSEANPKSNNYWIRESGDIISQGTKYDTALVDNTYKTTMKLTIKSVSPDDYGAYKCVSKNSLGDTDGSIKLYHIATPTTTTTSTTSRTTERITSTTARGPIVTVSQTKRKPTKSKNEVNYVNSIPVKTDKDQDAHDGKNKLSKVTAVGSGFASTIIHSASKSRSADTKSDVFLAVICSSHVVPLIILWNV